MFSVQETHTSSTDTAVRGGGRNHPSLLLSKDQALAMSETHQAEHCSNRYFKSNMDPQHKWRCTLLSWGRGGEWNST